MINQTGQKMRVICVCSGKGGVGTTLSTVHFAMHAARLGRSVLLLDGDFGLSNVDVVLCLKARSNISNVLKSLILCFLNRAIRSGISQRNPI